MTKKFHSTNVTHDKNLFTSELDKLFHDFDHQRTLFSISRLEELQKHQLIAAKRDKS